MNGTPEFEDGDAARMINPCSHYHAGALWSPLCERMSLVAALTAFLALTLEEICDLRLPARKIVSGTVLEIAGTRPRLLPLVPELEIAIRRWLKVRPPCVSAYLLVSATGGPLSPSLIHGHYLRMGRIGGFDGGQVHARLRRWCVQSLEIHPRVDFDVLKRFEGYHKDGTTRNPLPQASPPQIRRMLLECHPLCGLGETLFDPETSFAWLVDAPRNLPPVPPSQRVIRIAEEAAALRGLSGRPDRETAWREGLGGFSRFATHVFSDARLAPCAAGASREQARKDALQTRELAAEALERIVGGEARTEREGARYRLEATGVIAAEHVVYIRLRELPHRRDAAAEPRKTGRTLSIEAAAEIPRLVAAGARLSAPAALSGLCDEKIEATEHAVRTHMKRHRLGSYAPGSVGPVVLSAEAEGEIARLHGADPRLSAPAALRGLCEAKIEATEHAVRRHMKRHRLGRYAPGAAGPVVLSAEAEGEIARLLGVYPRLSAPVALRGLCDAKIGATEHAVRAHLKRHRLGRYAPGAAGPIELSTEAAAEIARLVAADPRPSVPAALRALVAAKIDATAHLVRMHMKRRRLGPYAPDAARGGPTSLSAEAASEVARLLADDPRLPVPAVRRGLAAARIMASEHVVRMHMKRHGLGRYAPRARGPFPKDAVLAHERGPLPDDEAVNALLRERWPEGTAAIGIHKRRLRKRHLPRIRTLVSEGRLAVEGAASLFRVRPGTMERWIEGFDAAATAAGKPKRRTPPRTAPDEHWGKRIAQLFAAEPGISGLAAHARLRAEGYGQSYFLMYRFAKERGLVAAAKPEPAWLVKLAALRERHPRVQLKVLHRGQAGLPGWPSYMTVLRHARRVGLSAPRPVGPKSAKKGRKNG